MPCCETIFFFFFLAASAGGADEEMFIKSFEDVPRITVSTFYSFLLIYYI